MKIQCAWHHPLLYYNHDKHSKDRILIQFQAYTFLTYPYEEACMVHCCLFPTMHSIVRHAGEEVKPIFCSVTGCGGVGEGGGGISEKM